MIIEAVRKIIEAVRFFVEAVRLIVEAGRVLQSSVNKSIPIDPRLWNNLPKNTYYPISSPILNIYTKSFMNALLGHLGIYS